MAVNTLSHSLPYGRSSLSANPDGQALTAKRIADLSSVKLDVSIQAVARYFGGNGYTANSMTIDRIRLAIDEVSELIEPKATYTLCSISDTLPGEKVFLGNGAMLLLPECFTDPGACLVATVIGTLGERLEKQCRLLAGHGEIYTSTLLDAVGTAMLDLLSEKICEIIEQDGNCLGLARGLRFAPGLEGSPLEQQRLLFQIADSESVGVDLNSSFIMVPTKSISFFLMLTKTPHTSTQTNKCNSCRMIGCQYRIAQKQKNLESLHNHE